MNCLFRLRRLPLLCLLFALALVAGAGSWGWQVWAQPFPELSRITVSPQLLDHRGELLGIRVTEEGYWRLPVVLDQLDPNFLERLIATEDQRFHQHPGVDPLALVRAFGQWLTRGRIVSGGSTITMQTVRLLEPRPRTLSSKLVELVRAVKLERLLDKDELLSLYLTLTPYGGNIQGVVAASRFYFGKPPQALTPEEIALLVALPQAPEARRPDRHPETARAVRDRLLHDWLSAGVPDAPVVDWDPVPERRHPAAFGAPHLTERLRGLADHRGQVRTTLDAELQRGLETLLAQTQAGLGLGETAAGLIVEHRTGAIRAWVGSADFFARTFPGQVDVVPALRSPGSLLKPWIYGLAFDQGIAHPDTIVLDRTDRRSAYRPGNIDGLEHGEMTVSEALQRSRNIPAVRVLDRLGVDVLVHALEQARFPGLDRFPGVPGPAIALGALSASMLDIATLYGSLGQAGWVRRPSVLPRPLQQIPSRRVLSPAAAVAVADILVDAPLPRGFLRPQRPVAIKTGTSFAHRDAWAVGVTSEHTLVFWVGRPDGGYTPGYTGRETAVPLLVEAVALLPPAQRPWPVNTGTRLAMAPGLERFTPAEDRALEIDQPDAIVFRFPDDGATLFADPHGKGIHLELEGGEGTLSWFINGLPASGGVIEALTAPGPVAHPGDPVARQLRWRPAAPGYYRLTALDQTGHSNGIEVEVIGPGRLQAGR